MSLLICFPRGWIIFSPVTADQRGVWDFKLATGVTPLGRLMPLKGIAYDIIRRLRDISLIDWLLKQVEKQRPSCLLLISTRIRRKSHRLS